MVSLSKKYLNCLALLNQLPDEIGVGIADNFRRRLPADLKGEIIQITQKRLVSLSLVELVAVLDQYWSLREDQITDNSRTSEGGEQRPGQHQRSQYQQPFHRTTTMTTTQNMFCPFCEEEGTHNSTKCPKYSTPQERFDICYKKRLCFLCLKPTNRNHSAQTCDGANTRPCPYKTSWTPLVTCRGRHHPALHYYFVPKTSGAAGGGPQSGGGGGNPQRSGEGGERKQGPTSGNG